MALPIPLQASNAPQILPIPGGAVGCHMLYLAFAAAPSAGTVKVEWRKIGQTTWNALQKVNNVSILSGELAFRIDGAMASLRLTFTGLVGGANPVLWLASADAPNDKLYVGDAAMTIQTFLESNVKRGLQYYIQYNLPQLAANTSHKILFRTGAKQVLIKAREFYGIGQFINLQIFRLPTVTPATGSPITVENYDDVAPVPTTVTVLGGVTAPSNGTPWGGPQRLFGAATAGQRAGSGLAPGGDRRCKAFSDYLIVAGNADTGGSSTADADYFLSWYEGESDIPL